MTIPHLSVTDTALFTDFDGTLVAIAETPDGIHVPDVLTGLAANLNHRLQGAFALVTGRSLQNLNELFDISALAAAGSHGAEWQVPKQQISENIGYTDTLFGDIRPQVQAFARTHGLLLEDKRFSLALHFRNAPHLEGQLDDFLQPLTDAAPDVKLVRGKCVREIKPASINKGIAIERFMQMAPFAGRTPVFLGDDTTDEDGFRWVNEHGGVSIKIGEGATAANHRLADCSATLSFLQQLSDAQ